MITKAPGRAPRRLFALAALLGVALSAGCASIEHVRLYRDARAEFSAAADKDNAAVLGTAFPVVANAGPAEALASTAQVQASFERWDRVASLFGALNRRAASELRQDQLYGSSRVLELVARSHRAFYGHSLTATGDGPPATEARPAAGAGSVEALTVPVAEARELLKDTSVVLFARDAYLARSLAGENRYKIAFLDATRAVAAQSRPKAERVHALCEQMARAEAEVATATKDAGEAVERQAAISRLLMLKSARHLLTIIGNVNPDTAAADVPTLAARIREYRENAVDPNKSEGRLLQWMLGRLPTGDASGDLASLGLGTIGGAP